MSDDMPVSPLPQPAPNRPRGLKKPSSTGLKMVVIFILIVLMNIPLSMVHGLISERESSNSQVNAEISGTWGGEQNINGPILSVPYKTTLINDKGKPYTVTERATFLPERLEITGEVVPEIRKRGIYETVVYTTVLKVSGDFGDLRTERGLRPEAFQWKDAALTVGVGDIRGIQQETDLVWDGAKTAFVTGSSEPTLIDTGMHATPPNLSQNGKHRFAFTLKLNGSRAIRFTPLGKNNTFDLHSRWKSPSFVGTFLPQTHRVTDDGFNAHWEVSHFARNYPQNWTTGTTPPNVRASVEASALGVTLIQPVNFYLNAIRSLKYGILFIALSFLTFFLFEVLLRSRIHVVQYVMVGFALCIFYLLLISLAEIIGFLSAYILASLPTIALISAYTYSFAREAKARMAGIMFAVLGVLYTYLYVLLQLEEYSLIFGSVGLFAALATVMFLTRNIDWYHDKEADQP